MATKKKAKKKRYWVNVYFHKRPRLGRVFLSRKEAKLVGVESIKTISFTI